MYIITQIAIEGIIRLKVKVKTNNIEAFRKECAQTYRVKPGKIKFIYDTID